MAASGGGRRRVSKAPQRDFLHCSKLFLIKSMRTPSNCIRFEIRINCLGDVRRPAIRWLLTPARASPDRGMTTPAIH
jgi:hypothetical protein